MDRPEQQSFNIRDYAKWKEQGSVHLQKMGNNAVFLVKDRYDPDSGEPVSPALVSLTPGQMDKLIEENSAQVLELQEQGAMLTNLKEDVETELAKE